MISVIIFLIISLIYNGYILYKYGVPVSLSETSYLLGGNKRYWFTAYCGVSTFLILPALLAVVPETIQFLPFFMCTGLLFSGASPLFKEGLDKPVHYVASIIAFISFVIFTILMMGWWVLGLFLILFIGLVIWKKECFVYFAEILAFLFLSIFILI